VISAPRILSPITGGQTLIRFAKGATRPLQVRHSRRSPPAAHPEDSLIEL
jgi:hypothetical protein